MSEPTVFVVDEDQESRNAIRDLVVTMNLRCELFAAGAEFLACFDRARPGCVVAELRVPGVSGLQIQRLLTTQGSLLPIIFLTAHPDLSLAVEAMRSGALHFLEKPFRTHELWNAIQEAIEVNQQRREADARSSELKRRLDTLTENERHLLKMLSRGRTNQEVAAELKVCTRTVEMRRRKLIKKLGVSSLGEVFGPELSGPHGSEAARRRGLPPVGPD